jgi:DNA polymerase III delta prime subunit
MAAKPDHKAAVDGADSVPKPADHKEAQAQAPGAAAAAAKGGGAAAPPVGESTELPWGEKYRPQALSALVGLEPLVAVVHAAAAKEDRTAADKSAAALPHLLFYGAPGTGKTTAALIIARTLQQSRVAAGDAGSGVSGRSGVGAKAEGWRANVLELNASSERGIDAIRERVIPFCKRAGGAFGGGARRFVILDEADAMTPEAQGALRRVMETQAVSAHFMILCNNPKAVIPPLRSRCKLFRFPPLSEADMVARLETVCAAEGLAPEAGVLPLIVRHAEGDMRRALAHLFACHLQAPRKEAVSSSSPPPPDGKEGGPPSAHAGLTGPAAAKVRAQPTVMEEGMAAGALQALTLEACGEAIDAPSREELWALFQRLRDAPDTFGEVAQRLLEAAHPLPQVLAELVGWIHAQKGAGLMADRAVLDVVQHEAVILQGGDETFQLPALLADVADRFLRPQVVDPLA